MSAVVRAPGKLLLTGAWAVLEGAPAVVLAVDRFAEAGPGAPSTMPEVVAVARRLDAPIPAVDVSALGDRGRKLGLGSSAAASVAAAGAIFHARGLALDPATVLEPALAAHRAIQPRGSGVDVAASAFGGAIVAQRLGTHLDVASCAVPGDLVWSAFALSRSASTRETLDRFAARRSERETELAFSALTEAAVVGAESFRSGRLARFLEAAQAHVDALEQLGHALDLPLVPPELALARDLLQAAPRSSPMPTKTSPIVLLPSGAGGGDTVLWLGARAPTDHETLALRGVGMELLSLALSPRGVHAAPSIGVGRGADRN